MNDREALAAALEIPVHFEGSGRGSEEWWEARKLERTAARERLAQLPERCGTCDGVGALIDPEREYGSEIMCPDCHGSGKVYPAELVERIGLLTTDPRWSHIETPLLLDFALAVLALAGETP